MDHAFWEQHLVQAERIVQDGERHIARQSTLIATLERDGHATEDARALLAQFASLQELHIEHRDRLRKELEITSAHLARRPA